MSTAISFGMASGLDETEQGVHRLIDHAVLVGDLLGLTEQDDRHLDLDLGVGVDPDEVDVGDFAAHRVTLQVLDDGELAARRRPRA